MNIANNKNFPHFNIKDTFIYSRDYNFNFLSPRTSTQHKISNHSLIKSVKPQKNILENNDFSSPIQEKPFPKKINKISHSININTMSQVHDPNGILGYLEHLQKASPTKIQFLSKIRLRKKKALFKSIDLNKNPIDLNKDLKSIVLNKQPTIDLSLNKDSSDKKSFLTLGKSKKILRFLSKNTSTDNENLYFNNQKSVNFEKNDSFSNKLSSNSSLKNVQIKNYRKSIMMLPPSRMTMIPEYLNLLEILRKICKNFRTINDKNQNKLQIIHILNSFIPEKKKYLERFFFLGDRLNPIINEKLMENVCIIQEKQWGSGYKEKLLKPGLLYDLQELNEKMDEYILKKEMTEIKFLEEDIVETFNQASKLKRKEFWISNIETLNYEKLKTHSIFDDLNEAERNCGTFELIALKEKKVGRLIDETIKKINFTNKRDKLQMKFLLESYKLT